MDTLVFFFGVGVHIIWENWVLKKSDGCFRILIFVCSFQVHDFHWHLLQMLGFKITVALIYFLNLLDSCHCLWGKNICENITWLRWQNKTNGEIPDIFILLYLVVICLGIIRSVSGFASVGHKWTCMLCSDVLDTLNALLWVSVSHWYIGVHAISRCVRYYNDVLGKHLWEEKNKF